MVKLDEKTRVSLQFNNFYAILVSIVTFSVVVSGWYVSINNKLTNIENTLAKMDDNFSSIHKDVVQNHDDIIVLKGLAERLK
jgi:hypothetical protein